MTVSICLERTKALQSRHWTCSDIITILVFGVHAQHNMHITHHPSIMHACIWAPGSGVGKALNVQCTSADHPTIKRGKLLVIQRLYGCAQSIKRNKNTNTWSLLTWRFSRHRSCCIRKEKLSNTNHHCWYMVLPPAHSLAHALSRTRTPHARVVASRWQSGENL